MESILVCTSKWFNKICFPENLTICRASIFYESDIMFCDGPALNIQIFSLSLIYYILVQIQAVDSARFGILRFLFILDILKWIINFWVAAFETIAYARSCLGQILFDLVYRDMLDFGNHKAQNSD